MSSYFKRVQGAKQHQDSNKSKIHRSVSKQTSKNKLRKMNRVGFLKLVPYINEKKLKLDLQVNNK